jgi:ribosome biogenesis GTPase A
MTEFSGLLEKYYGVGIDDDKYLTLEAIAKKRKLLSRGGGPDITRASRMILRDWQTGKIVM